MPNRNDRRRILVADDDRSTRLLLQHHLTTAGDFDLVFAIDGYEALAAMDEYAPDLVIIDLCMPRLDGISVIREIRRRHNASALPIIFISAVTDKNMWVEAFAAGANDFVAKPYQRNELLARITTHLEVARLTRRLERQNEIMERERKLAAMVQKHLMPGSLEFPGLEAASLYRAQKDVGGDFIDAWQHGSRAYFAMADISGHGASAAMLMAFAKGLLNSIGRTSRQPEEMVREMNARLYEMLGPSELGMFLTMALCVVDRESWTLTHLGAGHPPPCLAGEDHTVWFESQCPALGLLPEIECRPQEVSLNRGETLFLYTDGLTEIRGPGEELFGHERLLSLLRPGRAPRDLVEDVLIEAMGFGGGALDDDLAMLALRRLG